MATFDVVFRVLNKLGTGFIEPRREDGHGSSDLNPSFTADSGETEYSHKSIDVTAAGDTPLIVPAAGKRVRIRCIYAINDPTASTPCKIKIRFGSN